MLVKVYQKGEILSYLWFGEQKNSYNNAPDPTSIQS